MAKLGPKSSVPGTLTTRGLAVGALCSVEVQGAYAHAALDRVLEGRTLPPADRSLVTELAYGALRYRAALDWAIELIGGRKVDALEAWVRNSLRVGFYQLLFMSRIPASAACDESVKAAKARSPRAAGLVNAVLRSYLREPGRLVWPDETKDPIAHLAIVYSHPRWIVERYLPRLGFDATKSLLSANNGEPPLSLRVNALKTSRSAVIIRLAGREIACEPTRFSPDGVVLRGGAGRVGLLPEVQEGILQVQDESSMLIGRLLSPRAGEEVLDTCSAPGGKSTHLAELMRNTGRVLACDVHGHKLELVRENCARLGLTIVEPRTADARLLGDDPSLQGHFDRVLVDAPCSGLGVLRRRPDSRWRKSPADIAALQDVQRAILEAGAACLRPGGRLVYSTCTTEPEENEGRVREFLATHRDFTLAPADSVLHAAGVAEPETLCSGPFLSLWPHVHGTDGFFAACLTKAE